MVFKEISNGISKIASNLKRSNIERVKVITTLPPEGEEIPLALEKDNARLKAKLAKEKIKRIKLEKREDPESIENKIKEKLYDDFDNLRKKDYDDALSIFNLSKKIKSKNINIKIVSYNDKKVFGTLKDFAIRSDGQISIIVVNSEGVAEPLISGSSIRDIFYNFSGLVNTISGKRIAVCLDENYKYVDNPMEKDVPDIIEVRNKLVFTRNDIESFKNRIIDYKEKIEELRLDNATKEEALSKSQSNERLLMLKNKLLSGTLNSSTTALGSTLNETKDTTNAFLNLVKENRSLAYDKKHHEDRIDSLESSLSRIVDTLEDEKSKTNKNKAMDEIKQLIRFIQESKISETDSNKVEVKQDRFSQDGYIRS